jgi:hypothetical protein
MLSDDDTARRMTTQEWIRHVQYGNNIGAADDKQLDSVYNARWATELARKKLRVTWLPRSYLQFYTSQVGGGGGSARVGWLV